MPNRRMNSLKSRAMNCGPLSVMIRGCLVGELLLGPLHDDFRVVFRHPLADFPVDDVAAVAVEDADQEVERAGDVQVRNVDVPVLVRAAGLDEARALAGIGRAVPCPSRPAGFSTR